ncbi:putative arabinan endo-1,5-alpha-L-arabinosidase C [Mollisia scopiformis]|uniref:Arabinan endo-1,5-alpha-L-arabinosidase n=1 Tax=Mollisia scopiformis TaxID=149040 RepID=A0A194XD59_MOLSC|nr:putative arabinan endo-1,5-alpha-L-arabinosidase C [Mollisia scopiformis]KUJ18108.1 putative arabinan endo-1,5-alpha-L-arabinosidase C [Mollisia scopiformis]
MFSFLKPLLATILVVAPIVQAYSSPGACSGACWAHDPAIAKRSDGTYFKFNTGGGIEIATASAIEGPWTLVGYSCLSSNVILNANNTFQAPDVSLVDGVYHLYYAVSTFGSQVSEIGLATSTTLEPGSWTDLGATGVASTSAKPYNAIDPNLILVGSTYLLNFGSFWQDIYQVALNSAATKTAGTSAYNIEYDSGGDHPCEGSFMFYYDGYYYLLWSHGICCNYETTLPAAGAEYMIKMCRSTSATSGFVDKSGTACLSSGGTILLESHGVVYGPGGQGVLYDSSLGYVLYYHYADTNDGLADADYLFGWNVLTWSDGWPVV